MLLAIDTSAGTGVAVIDPDGRVLAERQEADTMRHAEVIGTLLDECLTASGVDRCDIRAVVAGMGPGPFTGLRVGIAAARVLATGLDVRVIPVVSHDALAHDHYAAGGTGSLVVVTDARRRDLYWSVYREPVADGVAERTAGPGLSKPDDVPTADHRLDATAVRAASLAQVARRMDALDLPFAADEALYLRSPDVTVSAGPKRVTS
ncbi:tRNA (adenosine(37)-N6)-threonylcarbamoyltransferase complex dimerization subunit type 1 TsaB [Clavibacter capsici]|uniref:tRNA (Adenosine(37)-N6)-threonylcarbamoyltransferase complex dimerization subunit type 1 TsaB n=1 Tax=Clavibacter capsici TaxID=1874630 RepID=A0AAE7CCJ6_9MICO|nr:tRNA (adenosine(37)-N6)-threonylcarbamoyltransferase complex dimerization subunit type 1 TsaB [Clavibacter capsici]QIS45822.1 tRNA (adenosine(37)-N6)-threonylcarbamoyltransferase complex dimerization subunit type 1 TsaB [Clavibacter capsici]